MMNRGKLDAVADALRLKDAAQRGVDVDGLLPFGVLTQPEQSRWTGLAVAAVEAWAVPMLPALPEDGELMSNADVETIVGCRLGTKVERVSRGDVAFRRVAGGWMAYPEYPS